MERQSVHDLVMALYGTRDPGTRVEALIQVVLDLMVEVEALRGALTRLFPDRGAGPVPWSANPTLTASKGAYAAAYVDASYTSHDGSGPSGGLEKILALFYPVRGDAPREVLMLRRLGFSDVEIARFLEAAEEAETFT
jgi:hypothetical protein